MANFKRGWAILAATALTGGQALAAVQPMEVRNAPIHAVPADVERAPAPLKISAPAPIELPAPRSAPAVESQADAAPLPETLNAQYAAIRARLDGQKAPEPAAAPEVPAGPAVALARNVIESAGAFEGYMRRVGAIDAKFADAEAVAAAVSAGSGYEPKQLEQGAIAYAALVALQDPMFVQAVHDIGFDAETRANFADALVSRPSDVMDVVGADRAAGLVTAVLGRMGFEALQSGRAIKQAAYDVQRQPWSKEAVVSPDQRLAKAKAQSGAKFTPTPEDTAHLVKTVLEVRKTSARNEVRSPTPVVMNGLALAALAVLGEAGDDQADRIAGLLAEPKSADCVKMAKLNLFQCLAVAGPHYEDVFCLGQHAVMETAQCVVTAVGQSPAPAAIMLAAAEPAKPASFQFPIALDSSAGPERDEAFGQRVRTRSPAREEAVELEPPPPPPLPTAPAAAPRRDNRSEAYVDDRGEAYAEDERAAPRRPFARTDRYYDEREDYAIADDYRRVAPPARQSRAPTYREEEDYYDRGYAPPAPAPAPRQRYYLYDRQVPDYEFDR